MKPGPDHSSFVCKIFTAILCLLSVVPSAVHAFDEDEPMGWGPDFTEQAENWQEQESGLPAYPEEKNLLEVDAGTDGLQYTVYLDETSLVKSDDSVVRYTVVLVSSTGIWNVSYEGLHCGERQYRRYAYGVNGKWQLITNAPWKPLRGRGANKYRRVFYEKYICDPTRLQESARQILDRFRENWHERM